MLDNKPSFVVEWNDKEFKDNTAEPHINQDNPYNESMHRINYRLSKIFQSTETREIECETLS